MARLAAPVLLHAAPRERCVRVRHHLRVAANHNPGALRGERHARCGLQAALLDREGNASVERAGSIFPAHERDQAHLLPVLAQQPREAFAVGQLLGMAHRVNQDHLLEALPGYLRLQDRQERADSRSRRYQPEVLPVGENLWLISTRSEEHTSELQSLAYLVCRLLLEKKKKKSNV